MMKNDQSIIVFGLLLLGSICNAQFNTLTPTLPIKFEGQKLIENPSKNHKKSEKKEKKSLKKVFNITTKEDLRNEIDSLKVMMRELKYNPVEKTKMNDSVWEKPNKVKEKESFAMYDLIEEPKESFSKIVMPLQKKLSITSGYGVRIHPIKGTKKMHNGVDLAANYENVHAVMDGIVTASGWDSNGGGYYIKINHFDRFETSYLHLDQYYYSQGETVKAGYIIAKSGNTGSSTGPHLHFAVKEYGAFINPTHFLNDLIKVNNLIALYNE